MEQFKKYIYKYIRKIIYIKNKKHKYAMNFYFSKYFNIFVTRNWKMSGNDIV